jgi:hypothetical protein
MSQTVDQLRWRSANDDETVAFDPDSRSRRGDEFFNR